MLPGTDEPGDGELLERFLTHRDEAAFEGLLRRHGPMVLSVCQRVLGSSHDAEDAFQVTFLVLVRKAASVVPREMVGSWLHGVAYRTALQARASLARCRSKERQASKPVDEPAVEAEDVRELIPLLDREISRLPGKYRAALVLCELDGKSRKEAAGQLGLPEGTLSSRLATARRLLAQRLARHGVTLTGAALVRATTLASVPEPLAVSTSRAAMLLAAGKTVTDAGVSAKVAVLTTGVLKAMFLNRLKTYLSQALVVLILGLTALVTWAAQGRDNSTGSGSAGRPMQPRPRAMLGGTWQLISYEVAGLQLVGDSLRAKDVRLTFDEEGRVSVRVKHGKDSGVEVRGTYQVDSAASPKTIDLTFTPPGQTKQVRLHGIYAVKEGQMRAVFGLPGSDQRPKRFDTESDNVVQVTIRRLNRSGATTAEQRGKGDRLSRLIDRLVEDGRSDAQVIEALYLAALSRLPGVAEKKFALTAVSVQGNRREAFDRLLWVLTNSEEYLTDLDARTRRAPSSRASD
jgi:RNA polymerase sigma-70 factor (ECF subfamily)